ncbi:unnamed protein product [Rotaria magnacalcarata]
MAYSSRTLIGDTTNGQRAYDQQNPTISKLVRPPDDRYTFSPQDDSRYRTDLIRTEDRYNESIRRPGEDPYSIKNIVNGNNRPNTNYESSKPIPTSHVVVDPIRRPAHGNARTGVVEINIAVSFGGNRNSQGSYAVIDDVGYIDINFQSPQKTAKLSTDGIIRNQSSQASVGFSNTNTNY